MHFPREGECDAMLCVSENSLQVFEANAYKSLAPRIEAWLLTQHPEWSAVPQPVRTRQLDALIHHAQKFGMISERDFAVFAHLCVASGPDWQRNISEGEIGGFLADPQWEPEAKLLALDEFIIKARSAA